MKLFVYGILKRGENPAKVSGYRLIDLGWFPAAIPASEDDFVVGELLEVDEDELAYYDMVEGVPHLYQRRELDDGWFMYVINESAWDRESVASSSLEIIKEDGGTYYKWS